MTTKDAFTDEEWTRLMRAPFVAGMAISLADPGGPIEAFKETSATLKAAHGIVAAKAPDEADAFAAWLGAVAQAAADAAKEGGFMGFHAQRVSEGEQRMLDSVRDALAR
jgi:hypothetical protein